MPEHSAAALFIRNPEPGAVKTRLAAALGPERAARFYWECALLVMAKALRLPDTEVFVFFRPAEARARVEELVMARYGVFEGRFIQQEGDNPGERIHAALAKLSLAGHRTVAAIGLDSPTLPEEELEEGLKKAGSADFVLGPTWSGGIYFIATRKPDERVFRNVSWSSGLELSQVIDNITSLGLTFTLLRRWQEVDTPEDLEFLEGQVRKKDYQRLREILGEQPGAGGAGSGSR